MVNSDEIIGTAECRTIGGAQTDVVIIGFDCVCTSVIRKVIPVYLHRTLHNITRKIVRKVLT
jgi:hypothetical protein